VLVAFIFTHKDPRFAALFAFDLEIERTFHRLERHHQFGERYEEGTSVPTKVEEEEAQRRTL